MKCIISSFLTTLIFFVFQFNIYSQVSHLEVEGDVKIRGQVDIHEKNDTSSVYIGNKSGKSITVNATNNTFLGAQSGASVTSGNQNTLIGFEAGKSIMDRGNNTFIGYEVGIDNTAGENCFVGASAGLQNSTGEQNVFIGQRSGAHNTKGEQNTFVGRAAGNNNRKGSNNTIIGAEAGVQTLGDSLTHAMALGAYATVGCSNCAVIGGIGENSVQVGIGVDSPTSVLMLLEHEIGVDPVGITQGHVGQGSSMELTTSDGSGEQATRMLFKGGGNFSDIAFYRGARNSEQVTVFIEGTNGNMGIGTTNPNDALDVVGDIDATGCLQTNDTGAVGGTCLSDRRLKTNIISLDSQLDKLMNLRPVRFQWKEDENLGGLSNTKDMGFIAQEVAVIFPEMVVTDNEGFQRIRYDVSFQVRMVKALQELGYKNQQLEAENIMLKERLERIEALLFNSSDLERVK